MINSVKFCSSSYDCSLRIWNLKKRICEKTIQLKDLSTDLLVLNETTIVTAEHISLNKWDT